jgi:flagellar FliJ protein
MARFRFKLEPLLRARKLAEQRKQRAVAECEAQRMALEDALRRQQQFIVSGKQDLRDQLVGALDVSSMRAHAGATIQLMRKAERMVLELAGVHRRLDAARAELIEATRSRRAVELLKERRLQEFNKSIERAEAAALDELAVQAAARKEQA